ncbi:MAG: TetR/AcrR family transcriptional regulator [Candidatus Electryonea clarkiae]|nr:TetR/AcrR family transcriptional regulator [Candidatus Electryonea clarkiae]MDP8287085.1 TetR/AcrR family transcriptional regulator [Candidatus Electryonea clarkiae]
MLEKDKTQIAEKRQRFYTSGEPLFERFGFKKTTVEDICATAGVSKRTFYELFKDKTEFFARMALHISEDLLYEWQTGLPETMNAPSKILSFIDFYVEIMIKRPVFRLFSQDPEALLAFGVLGSELSLSPIIEAFREIIDQGKDEGNFRILDTDIAVWMIMSLMDSMYLLVPEFFETEFDSEEKEAKLKSEIKQFILHALGGRN